MMAIKGVAVVIPAHNEERLIERCVASVRQALADPSLAGLARQVVVVADRCTDRTAGRTWRALRNAIESPGVIVAVGFRSAGRARAAGVAEALRRWPAAAPTSIWLANTDADTTVPADWIARQVRAEQLQDS
jgi:cellulose synthase/poly-beta-1,6-N-acetylglucosamine synthase-like glycosyltransferase